MAPCPHGPWAALPVLSACPLPTNWLRPTWPLLAPAPPTLPSSAYLLSLGRWEDVEFQGPKGIFCPEGLIGCPQTRSAWRIFIWAVRCRRL